MIKEYFGLAELKQKAQQDYNDILSRMGVLLQAVRIEHPYTDDIVVRESGQYYLLNINGIKEIDIVESGDVEDRE